MATSKWFEWLIILVSAATMFSSFVSGSLDLVSAPRDWLNITRENDPGRFWAFIVFSTIVTCALIVDVLLR